MAEINAQLVKKLRELTGAGMMDCKKALTATNGDTDAAVIYLRKQGIASATKKETRATKQGLVASYIRDDAELGVLVEVNCESDFVARTDDFKALASDIAAHIAETKPKAVRVEDVTQAERANFKAHEALYEQKFTKDQNTTVAELVKTKIAKLGENITISRFSLYEVNGTGVIGSYIHAGSQIGVLVEMNTESEQLRQKDEFKTLVHDVAMQVAAAHPQFLDKDSVPAEVLNKEREIQRERALAEGKPEKMVDRIAEGRVSKFYEEVCLLEQPFIRDNAISVSELIRTVSGKLGGKLTVSRFIRYKVGESGDAPGDESSPLPVTA